MNRRAKRLALFLGLLLLPMAVWLVIGALRNADRDRQARASQTDGGTSTCLDSDGQRYSQGALLRFKDRGVLKCVGGRWIDPSGPRGASR